MVSYLPAVHCMPDGQLWLVYTSTNLGSGSILGRSEAQCWREFGGEFVVFGEDVNAWF